MPAAPAAEPVAEPAPATEPQPRPRAQAKAQAKPKGYVVKPGEKKPGDQRPEQKLEDPYEAELERISSQVRCTECGAKVEPGTKICPKCGEILSKGMRRMRRYGSLVAVCLGAYLIVTWPYAWPAFLAKRAYRPAPVKYAAEVLNFSVQKAADNNLYFVRGVVTNHAPVQLFGVKVEFSLLDRGGAALSAIAVDQIQILEPHKTWGFKALVLDPDAVNAKLNTITWTR